MAICLVKSITSHTAPVNELRRGAPLGSGGGIWASWTTYAQATDARFTAALARFDRDAVLVVHALTVGDVSSGVKRGPSDHGCAPTQPAAAPDDGRAQQLRHQRTPR